MRIVEISGFKGYFISDQGDVYSNKKGDMRKLNPFRRWDKGNRKQKHLRVSLYKDGGKHIFQVHTLVFTHFIGPVPDGLLIRHLDDNEDNNAITNLMLGTPAENSRDAVNNEKILRGEDSPRAKLKEDQAVQILKLAKSVAFVELARIFNCSPSNIGYIVAGKTWKHLEREEIAE